MNKVYYSQADSRWANHPYPSNRFPKATIKSGGCGATSGAMIISSMVKTIYPDEMGDIFRKNGLRASTGTDPKAFEWIAKKYDLKVQKTIYINNAVQCLKKGGMVVAYCKAGGLFSTGGHIIVLAEIEGNNLIVYDPYLYKNKFKSGNRKCVTVKGNQAIVSVANFKKYCEYTLYCYELKEQTYKQGEAVEINVRFLYTGAEVNDRYLYDNFTEQCWIHGNTRSLIKDNKLIARAIFVYDNNEKCLVQVFDDQFWIKKKEITKKL